MSSKKNPAIVVVFFGLSSALDALVAWLAVGHSFDGCSWKEAEGGLQKTTDLLIILLCLTIELVNVMSLT